MHFASSAAIVNRDYCFISAEELGFSARMVPPTSSVFGCGNAGAGPASDFSEDSAAAFWLPNGRDSVRLFVQSHLVQKEKGKR